MNDDNPYVKSSSLHHYLFGYELPDTVLLLTKDGDCFISAAKKKCDFLQSAASSVNEGSSIKSVTLLVRNKSDENEENYSKLLAEAMKWKGENDEKVKIGMLVKEWDMNAKGRNPVVAGWQQKLDNEKDAIETVEVSVGLGHVMAIKDKTELDCIKKSSVLSNKVLKHFFIKKLEKIIDEDMKISHEALATEVDSNIEDPSKIGIKVSQDIVSSAYFPIIQSGGEYDLKVSAQPTSEELKYDIITVSFGSRYEQYSSNVARTFLVDPPKSVTANYELLLSVQEACLNVMRVGKSFNSVYNAATEKLRAEGRDDLVKCLPKNLGFSIGLDFRDGALLLSPKNNTKFRSGMAFNLSIGFSGLALSSRDKSESKNINTVSEKCLNMLKHHFEF